MRGFIVLCLAACAVAAPQGYNYNPGPQVHSQQQQHSSSGLNFGASQNFASTGLNTVSGSSGFVNTAPQQAFFGQQTQQVQQVAQQQQQVQQQQQAVISKRFFIHTAPEDVEEDYKERYITVGTPRKNYNVVFIKAPARSNKKTAIKIAPAVNEEKTVIYVLNKKTDVSDLQTEVVENAAPTSKPEVFFIKYKTNEEAQHAQREIQAQYDALGGSSQTSDEGVIPVTSVIGSLDNGAAVNQAAASTGSSTFVSGGQQQSGFQTGGLQSINLGTQQQSTATNNAYLPPNF